MEDVKIIKVIDSYISAVESENLNKQKKYIAKHALDLVNFKEYEYKNIGSSGFREFERKPSKVDKIDGNKAEGFMSFTEHLESVFGDKYDLITEGRVYLEKIDGDWKIIDCTRKNRLISEAMYVFKDFSKELNNVKISVDIILFSIFDGHVADL